MWPFKDGSKVVKRVQVEAMLEPMRHGDSWTERKLTVTDTDGVRIACLEQGSYGITVDLPKLKAAITHLEGML